jgi:hypothetical protein
MTNGSGGGSGRPKDIRIRNTGAKENKCKKVAYDHQTFNHTNPYTYFIREQASMCVVRPCLQPRSLKLGIFEDLRSYGPSSGAL